MARDLPGDIDRKAADRSAKAAAASLRRRQRVAQRNDGGLLGRITKPVTDTYNAIAQLAGAAPPRQTALRGGAYEKVPRQAARLAYDVSPLKPFVDFGNKPTVGRGILAALSAPMGGPAAAVPAVAITTKMTQLRRALGVGNDREARRIAAELAEMADMPMVPLNRNVRDTLDRVLPLAEKGKIKAGGVYRLPVQGRYGEFVSDRTAIIQNPETGTMFVAPGAVHGEVMLAAQRKFPDASPSDLRAWLQHEVYDQHEGYDAARKQIIPARFMKASVHGDTENATIARAAFLQNLQRLGAVGDVKSAKAAREAMLAGTGPTRNVARDPAHVMAALTNPRGGPANRRVARAANVATERDIRDLLIRARKHPPKR